MEIEFLDLASKELFDTVEYYEYEQKNLGIRFLNEVESSVERIKEYSKAWHPLSKNTRRSLVKGFPYGIVYQIRKNSILVIAVANLHREPSYWSERGETTPKPLKTD